MSNITPKSLHYFVFKILQLYRGIDINCIVLSSICTSHLECSNQSSESADADGCLKVYRPQELIGIYAKISPFRHLIVPFRSFSMLSVIAARVTHFTKTF